MTADLAQMEAAAMGHVRSFFDRARTSGPNARVVISYEGGVDMLHSRLDGSRRLILLLDWPAGLEPG